MRHRLGALALGSVWAWLACASAPPPRRLPAEATATRAAAPVDERVLVYFPPGTCTGQLEIERFDRAAGAWRPHPEAPRLEPGACLREPAGQLLNELRVRCVDPTDLLQPSAWVVGAELGESAAPCAGVARP